MSRQKLFDRIKDSIAKEGLVARSTASREWLRQKMKEVRFPGAAKETFINMNQKSVESIRNKFFIGNMYFFAYNPKFRDTLPYYDIFPLVLPVENYGDSFLGLNLHYLPPKHRIILLDKLSDILTDTKFNEKTRYRISYDYLKATSKVFEATPCIKKYLWTHVRSRFLRVTADEFDLAVLLPFEQFQKQSSSFVWAESLKKFK